MATLQHCALLSHVDFCQTVSVNGDPPDLFDQPLLLDMIFLGTPQLCGGVYILFVCKVSFQKHPSPHGPKKFQPKITFATFSRARGWNLTNHCISRKLCLRQILFAIRFLQIVDIHGQSNISSVQKTDCTHQSINWKPKCPPHHK